MSKQKKLKVSLNQSFHLIIEGKCFYVNYYNKEQYHWNSFALLVNPRDFVTYNDLCKLYHCARVYITIKNNMHRLKKTITKHYKLFKLQQLQMNLNGITIRFFKIRNNCELSNDSALRKYIDFLNKN